MFNITSYYRWRPFGFQGNVISSFGPKCIHLLFHNFGIQTRAFIKNFGMKKGAIASTVAHDSHNIIAVGVSDRDITAAVNAIIRNKGGLSVAVKGKVFVLPLPIAGLMSSQAGDIVARKYEQLTYLVRKLGSKLTSPFMTLSFMSLLVIPHLKLSDKGLFDADKFQFI